MARRRNARAVEDAALGVQSRRLDLGAAEIDAYAPLQGHAKHLLARRVTAPPANVDG
jgi:hypothetical protein